ncbi:MAG: basic amino acid ABC transporter substrate-binding protein [Planctomycetes bacterium]|nr:basic amino acid ABC transporter substrate-binding protein [Planctomycetota bacterium]
MRNLLLAAAFACALTGCSQKPAGPPAIRVGTEASYVPFEFQEGGEIKGFDADLIRAVGREIGRPVELSNSEFQGLVPGLKTNRYDAVISCVTITEERKKEVDFSDPYYDAGQIVAVRADESAIKSKDDLKGKRIGAQSNTTGLEQAKTLGGSIVKEYEDVNMAFQDLANNQIDAVINDEPVSRRLAAVKPGFKVVGEVFTKEQYGIVVKKGDAALQAEINKALKKIRESGELQKLKEKWITNPGK